MNLCNRTLLKAVFWIAVVVVLSCASHLSHGQDCSGGTCRVLPSQPMVSVTQPHPAVVRIVLKCKDGTMSLGSGTLVWLDTRDRVVVLTCWHIMRGTVGQPTVTFSDGKSYRANLLGVDQLWDLAALEIRRPKAKPMTIASRVPQMGDYLSIAGYGSGRYQMQAGRVTQYVAPGRDTPFEMVELSAIARSGDSGGPIFNTKGRLAGVISAARTRTVGTYCGRIRKFLVRVCGRARPLRPVVPVPPPIFPPPVVSVPPVPQQPIIAPAILIEKLAKFETQIAALQAEVIALQKLEPIPAGNDGAPGPAGPPGPPGPAGPQGTINYSELPPITVRTLRDGKVIETERVYLGETLSLKLVPVNGGSK